MPAIRTPLLIAPFLAVAVAALVYCAFAPRPSLAASPEADVAPDQQAVGQTPQDDLDADTPPASPAVSSDDGDGTVSGLSPSEPQAADPSAPLDLHEHAFPPEDSFVKPQVSPAPDAAVRLDHDGRLSPTERRRWNLDEERARCLSEMRAKYASKPGDAELSPDRFRLRLDPDTQSRYYERREGDGTWRRFWPEEGRIGLRFEPRPDDRAGGRLAYRGYSSPGVQARSLAPRGRYRAAPDIPGLRLRDDLDFSPSPHLPHLAPFGYDGPWPWERDGESRTPPAEAAPDEGQPGPTHTPSVPAPSPEVTAPGPEARARPDLAA